jgi:hypothetical protein
MKKRISSYELMGGCIGVPLAGSISRIDLSFLMLEKINSPFISSFREIDVGKAKGIGG